ncbi:MAG: glycosyltransferase family 4 protein [Anaerolineae bacterium]|nr:glycosyltransferase family 4 protein [Anaerolineae bacterium]MCX8068094.1 glycosyltransferase family 4 protein [Anaerolineae bacterium]MDW7992269.1 glycosyltransferase family 4 protein [Anaerolineae bacterium]
MRILLVSHYVLPHYGGIEVVVENLAKGFVARGHEVKVLSSRIAGPAREERHGFEVIRIPAWNALERYAVPYPLFSPRMILEARPLVAWADVVHAHGFLYQPTLVALWLARKVGRPRVLTEHAGFVHYNRWLWNAVQSVAIHTLGRLSVALADVVVVVGTRAPLLIQQLAPSDKPVHLILNGVDMNVFHPVSPEVKREIRQSLGWDERPKVLFVGRLVPRKGIDLLLEALDSRYDVVLCGRGDMPLPERPGLLVYRSPDDEQLRHIYQAADLFVLPSHSEGAFPLTAQEAMACGLPVIAFFDPVYLAYVSQEVVLFVEPSAEAVRRAVLYLVTDEAERQRRSLQSAQWARTHFSWDRCLEKHLALYRSLVGG